MNQKSTKHGPKIVPKSSQKRFLSRPRFRARFGTDFDPIWDPTWGHLGGPKSGNVGGMLAKKMIVGGSRRHAKTTMISNTFRDPLGIDNGKILGS